MKMIQQKILKCTANSLPKSYFNSTLWEFRPEVIFSDDVGLSGFTQVAVVKSKKLVMKQKLPF